MNLKLIKLFWILWNKQGIRIGGSKKPLGAFPPGRTNFTSFQEKIVRNVGLGPDLWKSWIRPLIHIHNLDILKKVYISFSNATVSTLLNKQCFWLGKNQVILCIFIKHQYVFVIWMLRDHKCIHCILHVINVLTFHIILQKSVGNFRTEVYTYIQFNNRDTNLFFIFIIHVTLLIVLYC